MNKHLLMTFGVIAIINFTGCLDNSKSVIRDEKVTINKNPYPSTYRALDSQALLIKNATILTGNGQKMENGDILLVDGKIKQLGTQLTVEGVDIIDAKGKWLTPGLIDVHSHLGSNVPPNKADNNESTNPVTAEVWVEHSIDPQDEGFNTARAGGITTLQVLPGSANLFGGRGVTLRNVPATTSQGMKFPDAPYGLKMACGENPRGRYGKMNVSPKTRMGNVAGYRSAWASAQEYKNAWNRYEREYDAGLNPVAPERDIQKDTLVGVLNGEILVHNHCYKAEEMAVMIDLGKEFGYHSGTFHHAITAYKIANLLAENGNCVAMWPDWWGAKMEQYGMIHENVALVDRPENSCAIVHSDSKVTIQRLNIEASKIMHRANDNGFALTEQDAIRWITENPAKSLGILDKTGTLEVGKNADVVLWNTNPFSIYAKAEQVFVDGAKVYDRFDTHYQAVNDFLLGQK